MAGTVPDSVLGLAIFVDTLGGLAIQLIDLVDIMLLSATCVLSSIVNFTRHLDYTMNWKYIMIERYRESQDASKLALEFVGTTSCGWRMAVDYLLLYFYDVESLIVASWTAALLIDSYDTKLRPETKETFFIATRISAPVLPAIVVGIYCSVISLAVGSAMVLAILYKYLSITRRLSGSAAATTTQTPRSSVASKKHKSLTHAGLSLAIRFALIIMILIIFEASVITMQMVGYYTTLRHRGKPKAPDFTTHTARVQLGVGIPALMPSILLAFIFGTTQIFRDQCKRMIRACFVRHDPRKDACNDVECIVMEPPKPKEAMQSQCSKTIANLKGLPELDFPKPNEAMQSQCSKTIEFLKDSPGAEPPKPNEAMQMQCSKTIAFLRGEEPPVQPPKATETTQSQCSKPITFLRGEPPPIEPPKRIEDMQQQLSKTIAFLRGEPTCENEQPSKSTEAQEAKTVELLKPNESRPVTAVRLSKVSPVVIDVPPNASRSSERRSSRVVSFSEASPDLPRPSNKLSDCHSHNFQSGLCKEGRQSEQLRRDTLHHIENTISKPPSSLGFPPRKSSLASERSLGSTPGYKGSHDQGYAHFRNAPASPSPLTPASYRTFASDAHTLTSTSPTTETFDYYSQAPRTPSGLRPAYTSNRPASMHWSQAPVERPQDSPSLSPTQQQSPRPRPRPQGTSNPFLAPFAQISGAESPSTPATQRQPSRPRSRPQSTSNPFLAPFAQISGPSTPPTQQQPPRPRSRPQQSTTNPFLAPFAQISAAAGHEGWPSMPTRAPQPAVSPAGQRESWHERRSTEPSWPLRD
ncbi:hypothetical protein IWZ03DRAFT_415885 [Phyllosticta citriasiana]|uniref:Uncharacterized protein n=1 Tax=Phyllosticta citriasiana TaxID=595635 RepID=A0ABR1KGV4_9PEZI